MCVSPCLCVCVLDRWTNIDDIGENKPHGNQPANQPTETVWWENVLAFPSDDCDFSTCSTQTRPHIGGTAMHIINNIIGCHTEIDTDTHVNAKVPFFRVVPDFGFERRVGLGSTSRYIGRVTSVNYMLLIGTKRTHKRTRPMVDSDERRCRRCDMIYVIFRPALSSSSSLSDVAWK